MKLLIDHADIEQIRNIYEYFPVAGVTTNPAILARTKRDPYAVLKEIRELIGKEADLHAQVISTTADGMISEADRIRAELGDNTYVKIPVTKEGLKAIKNLQGRGNITATAVYTPIQAYLAGEAGAACVAPYVNRIENLGQDGVQTVKEMQDIFVNNHMKTTVIAASFKNTHQVISLARCGVAAATAVPDIIEGFIKNDSVTAAVNDFVSGFEAVFGEGATMK